jgi:SAM-dependent methyltransferase
MSTYDDRFFDTVDYTAAKTADGILGQLSCHIAVRSVLDLGCGRGAWLAWWSAHGTKDVFGVDGSYVDLEKLHIPRANFLPFDLTQALSLGREFDLVQSVEVAEHLPAAVADQFIDNIVGHGRLVMFSAAIPGQGGSQHINERPWEYWRDKFAARGFVLFDFLRPLVKDDTSLAFWYRHNVFLYAHNSIVETLPSAILATRVAGEAIPSYLPLWARISLLLVRPLPISVVDRLAKLKWQLIMWMDRFRPRRSRTE